MTTLRTARDRARADIQAQILATAGRHLAEHGPAGLSLRAVARDLELVPSAVYRYFENRDALLTAMIVEAYDSLGDAADAALAGASRRRPVARWVALATAIRQWAVANPHQYSLLYGTPVPGYAAPHDTVGPGTRVTRALAQVVADAHSDGLTVEPPNTTSPHGSKHGLTSALAEAGIDIPPDIAFRTIVAWTQLFGMLSFELFGQTKGLIDSHERCFTDAATTMAHHIGLASRSA